MVKSNLMNLTIVESPTKARKLSSFLGSNFIIRASYGHLRDLPKSKLGVDVEDNFKPSYQLDRKRSKVINEIKKLAKQADKIYLATDPDREGEAIAWHIMEMLDKTVSKDKFVRSTFHEITKTAVKKAIDNPTELNSDLVEAQQARRILDRLVGYKASPVLWRKVKRGLSAGRVQSVALRLLAEREKEIEAFKPEEYWEIATLLALSEADVKNFDLENLTDNHLLTDLFKINDKKAKVENQEQADKIDKDLKQANFVVKEVVSKDKRRWSLPPLITSTLQRQAATRLGFSGSRTMRLAQDLYEEGLITYHRTDSVNLSKEAITKIRNYVEETYGEKYLSEKVRVFKSKSKNAQEAHEAIRVTNFSKSTLNIAKYPKFNSAHQKLYDLIWRRTIACQMSNALYKQTTILVQASGSFEKKYLLKSSGSILKFDGFLKLFKSSDDVFLPELKQGETLFFAKNLLKQKFTEPPARYNDASLIKKLEELGIGRPSTYASIIEVLILRGYAERKEKRFFVSQIGMIVVDFLMKNLGYLLEYNFTAKMEDDLDKIADGKLQWQKVLSDFYQPFEKKLNEILENVDRVVMPVEETGEVCPECGEKEGGKLVIRVGRYGKFKSCNRFPDCKYKENIVEKIGMKCPLCGEGEVIVRKTRFGKDFFGCSLYPKCDWASWKKPEPDFKITKEEWEEQKKVRAERMKKRRATMAAKKKATTTKKETTKKKAVKKTTKKVGKKTTKAKTKSMKSKSKK